MRWETHLPLVAPQNVYPCRGEDEWVAISISDDDEWSSLQSLLERAALSTEDRVLLHDPAFCSVNVRMDRQVALDAAIAELDPHAAQEVPGRNAAGRGNPGLSGDDLL